MILDLRKNIENFEVIIAQGTDNSAEEHRQRIKLLEKRQIELREQEIAQWDEKIKGAMPPHVFDRLNKETLDKLEKVGQELSEAKNSTPEPIDIQAEKATFQDALNALLDPEAPAKEQNELVKRCYKQIDYNRERKTGHRSHGTPEPISMEFTRTR